jgi:hypothetical protein
VHEANAVVAEVAVHPDAIPNVGRNMDTMESCHISRLQFALINVFKAGRILNNHCATMATVVPEICRDAIRLMFG